MATEASASPKNWITNCASHIQLDLLTFLAAGALALVIALTTVAGHSFSVAR